MTKQEEAVQLLMRAVFTKIEPVVTAAANTLPGDIERVYFFDHLRSRLIIVASLKQGLGHVFPGPPAMRNEEVAALKLLTGIDWVLLREQKAWLVDKGAIWSGRGPVDGDAIEGLLALLDGLQDFAVDSLGLLEEVVFGPDYMKEKEAQNDSTE